MVGRMFKIKFLILFSLLISFLVIFYNLFKAETLTGKFIFVSSYVGIIFTLAALLFFFSVFVPPRKRELLELWKELFKCLDEIVVGKREELRVELEGKAKEFVEEVRRIAEEYKIKLDVLNKDNASDFVLGLLFRLYDIKHRADHPGARYVHEMRKNPDDLPITRSALKFLRDLRPEIYGRLADEIYKLFRKMYR